MKHIDILIVAVILLFGAIALENGGRYLRTGSVTNFWIEKILSRSLALSALLVFIYFLVKVMI